MSSTDTFDGTATSGPGAPVPLHSATKPDGELPHIDPQLIQETKLQIRGLVNEIAQLAKSDCTLADFYDGYLNRVVSALASVGGAIWSVGESGQLDLQHQVNLAQAHLGEDEDSQYQHGLLLRRIVADGKSALVHPSSGGGDESDAGNPTPFLLVLGVIKIDDQVEGIVEIFQRPGGGPTTQRGYLRFLVQMCDLAAEYLKNRRLRNFQERQALWDKLETFIHTIHGCLDVRETAYTVANEGRRLIDADRVSVALRRGGRCQVEVVSGLDSINRRSREVRCLSALATTVVRAGQPLWYHGDADDLPPQIEKTLHEYLDKSPARLVAVIPLREPLRDETAQHGRYGKTIGALIVEQLQDNRLSEALEKRIDVVAGHAADALTNALNYSSLFLLPLWRLLGKSRMVIAARNLPKTVLILAALVGMVLAACLVPADLDLSAPGALRPAVRRDVFAQVDGKLVDLAVEPKQLVKQQQVLARLEDNHLESEVIALMGGISEKQKEINAIERAIQEDPHMDDVEEIQLVGKIHQLREAQESAKRQLEVYREQQRQLVITSPVAGQVADWKVRDKLLRRPIDRGQRLMTVFDPAGAWELELQMAGRRMGKVDYADRQSEEPLQVTFILATHPGQEFIGHVVEIDRVAEVRDENGNTVRIRVAIDKEELPDLRDGAKVTARVHCGRRPIGYVWFHELIETVQAKVMFWL